MKKRLLPRMIALLLLPALAGSAQAAVSAPALDAVAEEAAQFVYQTTPEPQVAATGGEWAVIALARGGYAVDEGYFDGYLARLEETLRRQGGVLHERKYTEYARVILALSALGRDARNVAGYDLTLPLADYDKVLRQGVNGPIWAIIALDSARYPMPEDPQAATQATRKSYVEAILARQLEDGGWSLSGEGSAEPDLTGMALQALAPYRGQSAVAQAIDRALACMSSLQDAQGGYASWGEANAESCAQMVAALAALGIEQDDPRFVKNGSSVLDALLTYLIPGQGFSHAAGGAEPSPMASEQGLCALTAVRRFKGGQTGLYDMTDVLALSPPPGRSAAVLAVRAAVQAALCCLAAL